MVILINAVPSGYCPAVLVKFQQRYQMRHGNLRLEGSLWGDDTKVPKLSGSSNAKRENLGCELRFVLAEWPEDTCEESLIVTSR
jgi:hypothetical protein